MIKDAYFSFALSLTIHNKILVLVHTKSNNFEMLQFIHITIYLSTFHANRTELSLRRMELIHKFDNDTKCWIEKIEI